MKYFLLLLSALFLNKAASAQTAVDFTANDCSGVSHNLFTDLNAGKIVVLVWVMPCGTCINDAKAAYDAVQGFATTNPGRVVYWMIDDFGNSTCNTVSSWANTNAIPTTGITVFGNSGTAIDENNYGGTGMPHVVVCGGMNLKIYFNKKNGNNDGALITQAITQALTNGIQQESKPVSNITLFPNPAKNTLNISSSNANTQLSGFEIYNVFGAKVLSTQDIHFIETGNGMVINLPESLPKGNYILKLKSDEEFQNIRFTVLE